MALKPITHLSVVKWTIVTQTVTEQMTFSNPDIYKDENALKQQSCQHWGSFLQTLLIQSNKQKRKLKVTRVFNWLFEYLDIFRPSSSGVLPHKLCLQRVGEQGKGSDEKSLWWAQRKNPWGKDVNQQQTQSTYDAEFGNQTRATWVGGECYHYYNIRTPPIEMAVYKGGSICIFKQKRFLTNLCREIHRSELAI